MTDPIDQDPILVRDSIETLHEEITRFRYGFHMGFTEDHLFKELVKSRDKIENALNDLLTQLPSERKRLMDIWPFFKDIEEHHIYIYETTKQRLEDVGFTYYLVDPECDSPDYTKNLQEAYDASLDLWNRLIFK
jgi:hypothetical protein